MDLFNNFMKCMSDDNEKKCKLNIDTLFRNEDIEKYIDNEKLLKSKIVRFGVEIDDIMNEFPIKEEVLNNLKNDDFELNIKALNEGFNIKLDIDIQK